LRWTPNFFVVAHNGSIAATLVFSLYELWFTNNPFYAAMVTLSVILGIKDIGITDIKRVLRLYFIQQLAKDELVRSENMLDPDFHYTPNADGINSLMDAYREALRNENSQSVDHAVEVAQACAFSLDPGTLDFKRFYREFIKIKLQLLTVLLKRECSDYSDEVKYLYGDETGLSDPAFGSYEADSQPRTPGIHLEYRQNLTRTTR